MSLLNSDMDMTVGQFMNESSLFDISDEYRSLLKDAYEIDLIERYNESVEYLMEADEKSKMRIDDYLRNGRASRSKIALDIKYRVISRPEIEQLVSDKRIQAVFLKKTFDEKVPNTKWNKEYLDELANFAIAECFNRDYLLYLDEVAAYVTKRNGPTNSKVSVFKRLLNGFLRAIKAIARAIKFSIQKVFRNDRLLSIYTSTNKLRKLLENNVSLKEDVRTLSMDEKFKKLISEFKWFKDGKEEDGTINHKIVGHKYSTDIMYIINLFKDNDVVYQNLIRVGFYVGDEMSIVMPKSVSDIIKSFKDLSDLIKGYKNKSKQTEKVKSIKELLAYQMKLISSKGPLQQYARVSKIERDTNVKTTIELNQKQMDQLYTDLMKTHDLLEKILDNAYGFEQNFGQDAIDLVQILRDYMQVTNQCVKDIQELVNKRYEGIKVWKSVIGQINARVRKHNRGAAFNKAFGFQPNTVNAEPVHYKVAKYSDLIEWSYSRANKDTLDAVICSSKHVLNDEQLKSFAKDAGLESAIDSGKILYQALYDPDTDKCIVHRFVTYDDMDNALKERFAVKGKGVLSYRVSR